MKFSESPDIFRLHLAKLMKRARSWDAGACVTLSAAVHANAEAALMPMPDLLRLRRRPGRIFMRRWKRKPMSGTVAGNEGRRGGQRPVGMLRGGRDHAGIRDRYRFAVRRASAAVTPNRARCNSARTPKARPALHRAREPNLTDRE